MSLPDPSAATTGGTLAVEVTSRCNRSCRYCYGSWQETPATADQELPAPELVSLVEKALTDSGRSNVQISGGEPLLRMDLFEIIEGFRQRGRSVSLITDGGLLDTSRAVRLKELGVGPVQPTLLSGHPTVHDELKGTASFLATVAAIGRLMKVEVPVCVSFVCTRVNYQCFREVLELCFALGVRSVAFSRFCTAGRGAEQAADLTPTPHQIGTCLDIAEEARRALGMKIHMAISLPLCIASPDARPHLAFGRCALGTSSPGFTIDPMGHLRACSVSPVILGDLRRESWTEILDRAQLGYFQDVTRVPDACRGCELLVRCGGGCRESARGVCGDPGLPDPLARPGIRV